MDFSEAYKFTGPRPTFSPDGKYVACSVDARCVIRDAESLVVCHIFSCQDKIDEIAWCPTGVKVLCAMYSRAILQVWNVEEECWTCKIDGGPAGASRTRSNLNRLEYSQSTIAANTIVLWHIKQFKCANEYLYFVTCHFRSEMTLR
jgi:WD40 repeat protein